ncbi:hypothetical protein B8281_15965 [Cellulosimicrobium sp. TH-20]|uniref:hypothetical protein n=1 Tax=Cellulosimicrobium sp. TH-20 TaxID=1980001 RepID=UPI000A17D2EB|nr:hypothetical protein [Cellulosimicrobium sp. TH-20]ARK05988.1 hypothetical protein B8281_15965 [Cellulosimicrobium sp. TH-20]
MQTIVEDATFVQIAELAEEMNVSENVVIRESLRIAMESVDDVRRAVERMFQQSAATGSSRS